MSEWTKINSVDEIPFGDHLVIEENHKGNYKRHICRVVLGASDCRIVIVGHAFSFDMQKIIAYRPLSDADFPEFLDKDKIR